STTAAVFSQTTDASSTSTGALQSAGGLGVAKKGHFGDTVSLDTAWNALTNGAIDVSSSTVTIAASGNVNIPNTWVGLFALCEVAQTGGRMGLFLTGGGVATLVSQTASDYVITNAPAASKIGVQNNGSNASKVTAIYTGSPAASIQLRMAFFRSG